MIKVIGLLKRRPGMSIEAFREYYESTHRRIGEDVLSGYACRYLRRFLDSTSPRESAPFGAAGDFDVILEIWYPDEATYQTARAHLAQPDIARRIIDDEEQLFDRPRNRFFTVVEAESELPEPAHR